MARKKRKTQKNIQLRIFSILEAASPGDLSSKIFDIFITTLIFLNVFAVILETVKTIGMQFAFYFKIFEIFSITIFTIEYLLRLSTCTVDKKYKKLIVGRILYILTPFAIIDLIAILPFYLPMIIPFDLRFLRAIRLFRIFRILKIGRYSESLKTLSNALKSKKEQLMIALFVVLILLVTSSGLMYFAENEAQPEAFSSIPAAMWWGIITLTTIGYGDVYPITIMGKILGAIISILGIGIVALPTGIFASGLIDVIQNKFPKQRGICPYCGKNISVKIDNT